MGFAHHRYSLSLGFAHHTETVRFPGLSRGCPAGQNGRDPRDQLVPVVEARLAEEAKRRVPGTIVAIEHPAPVGLGRQQAPDRPAECTGQVKDGGIHADRQVELIENRGRVDEVDQAIAQVHDLARPFAAVRQFARLGTDLKAVIGDTGQFEERLEIAQGTRSMAIVQVRRAAGPDQADAQPGINNRRWLQVAIDAQAAASTAPRRGKFSRSLPSARGKLISGM